MEKTQKAILIDDEASLRQAVGQWLELAGYQVESFAEAALALKAIDRDLDGVVISDLRMPKMDGMALLAEVLARDPELPVVLISAHGDIPMAVAAMRQGAYDFIEKPFAPDILLEILRRAGEKRRLILENRALRAQLGSLPEDSRRLIGNSDAVQLLRQEISDLAPTDASVLLVGETGVGKEVVARCLHQASPRAGGPFVAINCGAIPESLFESELFGHEPGAFTGANAKRLGRFEKASGGTLFLDEVTAMPPNLQVKVLRVLQEREIERLGGDGPVAVDIRVISATNSDPRQACSTGQFREDLFYRLNLAEIHIPPLRRRGQDMLLLFEYFAMQAASRYQRPNPPLPSGGVSMLFSHRWPGNIRELKNVAERYILSSLDPEQRLPYILQHLATAPAQGLAENASLASQLERFEKCLLETSLKRHNGNIQAVMEELDVPRRTLNQKMVNHDLSRRDFLDKEPSP